MPAAKETWWTVEENSLIKKLVGEGKGFPEMAPLFPNRTTRAVECQARELGMKSGKPALKYSKNEAFWEIPNTLNSYYAGILAADGCLREPNGGTVAWICESSDESYVVRFARECKYTGAVSQFLKKSPLSDYVAIHSALRINSCRKWHEDMARNFNLTPQKTYRLGPPPFSSDLLLCCYLIGYIDGDGCIYPNVKAGPQINFVSASPHIIAWIVSFVERHFDFRIRKRSRKSRVGASGNHHHYSLYGTSAAKMIDFLRQIHVPRFTRKWDNPEILAMIDGYRLKWPHLWAPENELSFDTAGNLVRGGPQPLAEVVSITPPNTEAVA